MSQEQGGIHAEIGNMDHSQVAIGSGIQQTYVSHEPPSPAELEELSRLFGELKARVVAEAPPEQQASAVGKVEELKEAVQQEKPDIDTMAAVRNWFLRHLPSLAGAVTGLIVNPIVGKLVGVAGDALVGEFKRRFNV